jgi:hypothetical protein
MGVIENHNIAFRLISHKSKYCKVLSADDWLYSECIQKLTELAEDNPAVGIVGSYAINDTGIRWIGLPPYESVFEGAEVCRLYLRGEIDSFGTPSAVLYSSGLVRSHDPFYPGPLPNADLAACLAYLRTTDFAFVHQILSYERIHSEALSSDLREVNSVLLDRIQLLHDYGSTYLKLEEIEKRREELLRELYTRLTVGIVNMRGKQLWSYYNWRLEAIGLPLSVVRTLGAVCMKLADLLFNPKLTLEKIRRRFESE